MASDFIDYVIYSSAYNAEKNPDLREAERKGIPSLLYSEALGAISRSAYSSGVCGVHGKTTTTGLVGTILKNLDLPSQVLAGSIISSFGDSCTMTSSSFEKKSGDRGMSGNSYFVAETCEYQRHFMAFCPQKIILTSVESDHQDYYPTYNDIRDAFVDYICKLPLNGQLIYCADDKGACEASAIAHDRRKDIELIPYGEKASGDYKIEFGRVENGMHYFEIACLGECAICVPGNHNVRNAAAAIALCCELIKSSGSDVLHNRQKIIDGLKNFCGGRRRSEIVGRKKTPLGQDVIFIDDYGHHPTAVNTTLAGYREFYKNHKIIVDFMSHTYTRTAALLEEFASSFESADTVVINKIYGSARENAGAANVSGEILAQRTALHHNDVHYCKEFEEAADFVLSLLNKDSGVQYPDGYLVVTMGAGDNWKVGKLVMERL